MGTDPRSSLVTLTDAVVEIVVDPEHGADVLALRHVASGIDVLFSTPWRDHADQVVAGIAAPTSSDPVGAYLERYRGGWNTLCPNAGAPRSVHGAPQRFHGEAVNARWEVLARTGQSLRLRLELFSVPVVIERDIDVDNGSVAILDRVCNLSDVPLEIDYVSHPAFGGAFLDGVVSVDTNARAYTADPETDGASIPAGMTVSWTDAGLAALPADPQLAFGWLSEFDGRPWAAITNHDLGLSVRIAWDSSHLPFAWFWQELSWSDGFPWYRRARAFAIEPSSTVTSGPGRAKTLALAPHEALTLPITIAITKAEEVRA